MAYDWSDSDLASAKDYFTKVTDADARYKTAQARGLDVGQLSNLFILIFHCCFNLRFAKNNNLFISHSISPFKKIISRPNSF